VIQKDLYALHLSEILAERGNLDAATRAFCARKLNWSLAYDSQEDCVAQYEPTIPEPPPPPPPPEVTKADIQEVEAKLERVEASQSAVVASIVSSSTKVATPIESPLATALDDRISRAVAAYRAEKAVE